MRRPRITTRWFFVLIALVAVSLTAVRAMTRPYPVNSLMLSSGACSPWYVTRWSDGTTTSVKPTFVRVRNYPLVTSVAWADGTTSYHLRPW